MRSMHTGRPLTGAAGMALAVAILVGGCTPEQSLGSGPQFARGNRTGVPGQAIGEVEIVWPGGKGRDIAPGEEKLAFADIMIVDNTTLDDDLGEPQLPGQFPHGKFVYRVLNADGTLHREIVAAITGAVFDYDLQKVYALGEVVSDEKLCSGSGGCDGHDGGDGSDGGCSGGGGHSGGGSVPGKESRVGQVVVVKVHDRSSPGDPADEDTPGDGITWKWYLLDSWAWKTAEEQGEPLLGVIEEWPHLCKKEIIGGNVVVHMPQTP